MIETLASVAAIEGTACHGGTLLFSGLRLDLQIGWTCLVGPSGAGKSTVLRLLAGLSTAARFEGKVKAPPHIGYMAQEDLLQPRLSVLTNVLIGQHLRGGPVDQAAAMTLLQAVGLTGFEQRMPKELSGGQRQRVALARALMEDTSLALLDEPFSALDAANRIKMQDLARERLAGRAVLLVTHDPFEALRLGDRIFLLASGCLAQIDALPGPPPHSPLTEGFGAHYDRILTQLVAAT
jgi:putative hydroxymethylpyrimidine transport system ATP-binding protein